MVRPTILLVEDRDDIRDDLAREFQSAGARVLPAANASEALRMYQRQASEVAALVTDIRLENESEDDVSGVSLAKRISDVTPNLPRYGVTAFDSSVGEGVLHEVFRKTVRNSRSANSVYKHIGRIVQIATSFDDGRFQRVPQDLLDIKHKYRITSSDFTTLISSRRVADLGQLALLAWHDVHSDQPGEVPDTEAVKGSRYLQFVQAGIQVGEATLQTDLAVVARDVDGGVICELFGMPLVYAYADNDSDAIRALLEHLHECYQGMGEPDDFSGPNLLDVVRFRGFLNRLFDR